MQQTVDEIKWSLVKYSEYSLSTMSIDSNVTDDTLSRQDTAMAFHSSMRQVFILLQLEIHFSVYYCKKFLFEIYFSLTSLRINSVDWWILAIHSRVYLPHHWLELATGTILQDVKQLQVIICWCYYFSSCNLV